MSNYIKNQADKHTVKHTFSGKSHFFEVISGNSGKTRNVSIKINCDCEFTSVQGQANGIMCSHVLAVLREVINSGDIKITHTDNLLEKRNACKQLVRLSNMRTNKIRYGKNEGNRHQIFKDGICHKLLKQNKEFITEAIIDKIGLRADILILDTATVIEIADSELDDSLEKKRKKYESIGLKMEVVRI